MLDRLTQSLDFHAAALSLRAERTRVLAANIANADTPHYKARDFDFRAALAQATGARSGPAAPLARTQAAHLPEAPGSTPQPPLLYRVPLQTALDANTVELEVERTAFVENTVRYEASLRFLNGQIRTLLMAINGQP
ncbi:MAG: flagellar basal body rod protein FlgB [Burkholderiaceae bacterium]|nr:flagellar basal body rod protein FlgB [Burkholderiaceae bacterium]